MTTTRRQVWTIAGLMLALAVAAPLAPARAQATPEATADERSTPVLQTMPSPPRWFAGSDGRVHLVYELLPTDGVAGG